METPDQSVNNIWSPPPHSELTRQYVRKDPEVIHAIQLTADNFDEVVTLLQATPHDNRSALAFTDILLHSTRIRLGDYIIATSLGYLKMSQRVYEYVYARSEHFSEVTIRKDL